MRGFRPASDEVEKKLKRRLIDLIAVKLPRDRIRTFEVDFCGDLVVVTAMASASSRRPEEIAEGWSAVLGAVYCAGFTTISFNRSRLPLHVYWLTYVVWAPISSVNHLLR